MNIGAVASGGCDAYYEFGLHAWDMAAGQLIIQEAGGCMIDTSGKLNKFNNTMFRISNYTNYYYLCPNYNLFIRSKKPISCISFLFAKLLIIDNY